MKCARVSLVRVLLQCSVVASGCCVVPVLCECVNILPFRLEAVSMSSASDLSKKEKKVISFESIE